MDGTSASVGTPQMWQRCDFMTGEIPFPGSYKAVLAYTAAFLMSTIPAIAAVMEDPTAACMRSARSGGPPPPPPSPRLPRSRLIWRRTCLLLLRLPLSSSLPPIPGTTPHSERMGWGYGSLPQGRERQGRRYVPILRGRCEPPAIPRTYP